MIALVWGTSLGPVVAALIVDQPRLASRLALAPRRVMHALAAYICHALAMQQDTAQIAREIERQDVRALLSQAIPNPHPRLYRMLDRLGPTALDMAVHTRLNEVLHGPAADLLLDGGDHRQRSPHGHADRSRPRPAGSTQGDRMVRDRSRQPATYPGLSTRQRTGARYRGTAVRCWMAGHFAPDQPGLGPRPSPAGRICRAGRLAANRTCR